MKKKLHIPDALNPGDEFIVNDNGFHAKVEVVDKQDDDLEVRIVPLDRPVNLYKWAETWSYSDTLHGFTAPGGRIYKMI